MGHNKIRTSVKRYHQGRTCLSPDIFSAANISVNVTLNKRRCGANDAAFAPG